MKKEVSDLVVKVRGVAAKIGFEAHEYGGLVRLARALEQRSIRPVGGGHWYTKSNSAAGVLKRFLQEHAPDLLIVRSTDSPFDAETRQALLELAAWWQVRRRQAETGPAHRPRFKDRGIVGTKPTSLRLPKELLKAAKEKAETEGEHVRTGGNLSGLVALLLWEYLDRDPRFVEAESEPSED